LDKTEHILITACQNGDARAQRQLYQTYKAKLFGVCLRYANSREEAEDLLQEGFVKIFTDLYQYQPIGSFSGWMRKVVVNVALQHIRKKKNLFPVVSLDLVSEKYKPEEELFVKYRAETIIRMIQQLPEGYRAVFNLYVLEGYTHKEIGEYLNISSGTSKSQLARAKSTLRSMLEKNVTT